MKKYHILFSYCFLLSILIQSFSIPIIAEIEPNNTILYNYVEEYDLIIISTNDYEEDILPLINHKNNIAISTRFETIDHINNEYMGRDLAEKIKYYIKFVKEEYGAQYVLFIGDISDIPSRYSHIYFDEPFDYPTPEEWVFPSDFYYADLYLEDGSFSTWDTNQNDVFAEYHWYGNNDEFDLRPDIYLGRLACTNKQEVQTVINKIINYENSGSWTKEWFSNIVYIAGDGIPFDEEKIIESEYLQEQLIEIMEGFIPNKVWASNNKLLNVNNINTAIEEGAGFVFFNGHGLHDLWATYMYESTVLVPPGCYRTDHINELLNLNKLPIVLSDACYHLQYDDYPDCFGWSFVANPHGGSIAFIGGSDTDLAYAGTRIVEKGIEKLDIQICTLYQEGISYLGELWGKGLIRYEPGEEDLVDIITILQNHLFGDPSLQIAEIGSRPPETPNPPMGSLEGRIRKEYEFSTVTTDPDDDEIYYLFDFDDDTSLEWVGPYESGMNCTMVHSWTEKGSFNIKVKAKDDTGLMSDWSEFTQISMPKSREINYRDYAHFLDLIQWIISLLNT